MRAVSQFCDQCGSPPRGRTENVDALSRCVVTKSNLSPIGSEARLAFICWISRKPSGLTSGKRLHPDVQISIPTTVRGIG